MAAKWLQVDNVDATNECVNCAIPEKKLKKKKKKKSRKGFKLQLLIV